MPAQSVPRERERESDRKTDRDRERQMEKERDRERETEADKESGWVISLSKMVRCREVGCFGLERAPTHPQKNGFDVEARCSRLLTGLRINILL